MTRGGPRHAKVRVSLFLVGGFVRLAQMAFLGWFVILTNKNRMKETVGNAPEQWARQHVI